MKKAANIFQGLPDASAGETVEAIVNGGGVTIERIVSQGQVTPPGQWLESSRSEWVLLLLGEAMLSFFDGTMVSLKPGDHVNIPAKTRHRVEWISMQQAAVWLTVYYGQ